MRDCTAVMHQALLQMYQGLSGQLGDSLLLLTPHLVAMNESCVSLQQVSMYISHDMIVWYVITLTLHVFSLSHSAEPTNLELIAVSLVALPIAVAIIALLVGQW